MINALSLLTGCSKKRLDPSQAQALKIGVSPGGGASSCVLKQTLMS